MPDKKHHWQVLCTDVKGLGLHGRAISLLKKKDNLPTPLTGNHWQRTLTTTVIEGVWFKVTNLHGMATVNNSVWTELKCLT